MSEITSKHYLGQKHDWPGKICFIVLSSGLGGTEALAIRQSRWLRRHDIRTAIITRVGVMEAEYQRSFDQVIHLDDDEVDPGSLLMDEWHRLLGRIVGTLRPHGGWQFLVFGQDGLFLSSELSLRIPGSASSIYLVDDLRYGPARLECVESMSMDGLFISMNAACLDAHRRNFGYRLDGAVIIPLPVAVASEARGIRQSARVRVVTVARLVPMKGYVEGLIAAIATAVRSERLDVELLIVGDGPLLPRLRWAAFKAGILSRVKFVGSVPYAELPAYYRDADVFIGMGTTALEAAAQGVPVIIAEAYTKAFRSPGFFSTLHGFELGEPDATSASSDGASLLIASVKDAALREAEGEAGRQKILRQFSEDLVMERFVNHLRTNVRQVINVPSPGQDLLCGETKRYLKRLFRGSPKAASLRRRLRATWEACRAIFS
jgi:glycosyltransferase involved in cell wall biosynthesis